jgi:uncharacterized membrane protein
MPPLPQKTNTMAILGLVFAFVASPVGIVLSAIGLKQTKERNEGGRGLALAGLILSIIFTLIGVLVMIFVFAVAGAAVKAASDASQQIDAAASSASQALASESAAAQSAAQHDAVVAAACHVIVPAVSQAGEDLDNATSPAQIRAKLGALNATMTAAAASTGDQVFIGHVQKLAADFQAAADAVSRGQDPSSLEGALTADGDQVGQDCAAVGVSG